jgi:type II secretory pathway pseudopilin PulG
MTEDRLQSLLAEYAEPLRYQAPPPRRFRPARLIVVGVTATLATVVFLSLPRTSSAAAAARRMSSALANVQTMVAERTIEFGAPRETPITRWLYRGGTWIMQASMGTSREVEILVRDGRKFQYWTRHGTVTEEPDDGTMGGVRTALDFAKEAANYGEGDGRTMRVEDGPAHEGRPTYRLVTEGPDHFVSVIRVDRQTDLPIESVTRSDFKDALHRGTSTVRTVFRFNEPLPASRFDPRSYGRPILDLSAARTRLARELDLAHADATATAIHRTEATSDGAILALVSIPEANGSPLFPDTLTGNDGTRYLRIDDLNLNPAGLASPGRALLVSAWVPLTPPKKMPKFLVVGLSHRTDSPGHRDTQPVARTERVPVLSTPGRYPSYATVLGGEYLFDAMEIAKAKARGDYYREAGDFAAELPWRWAQHRAAVATIPRFGELQANDLATCLEALGRREEADKVRRELGPQPIKRYP